MTSLFLSIMILVLFTGTMSAIAIKLAKKEALEAEAALARYLERLQPLKATVIRRYEDGTAKTALYETRSGRRLTAKVVNEIPGLFVSLKRTKNGAMFRRNLA